MSSKKIKMVAVTEKGRQLTRRMMGMGATALLVSFIGVPIAVIVGIVALCVGQLGVLGICGALVVVLLVGVRILGGRMAKFVIKNIKDNTVDFRVEDEESN